ncbi:MAG TPA: patatin-like phospholipase family protein [Methylocella sp.]|nr:patatin-like phospholipase family protein [Methylocella sp.]
MFIIKAKEPEAAPLSHDRSRHRADARSGQVNRMPIHNRNLTGAAARHVSSHAAERTGLKVGIALGAGAARGWSHIGVLLELNAHGIYPEVVAGTSIGAVVGAAYAAGKLKEMEAFARSLTKRRVMSMMDVSFSGVSFLMGEKLRQELEQEFLGRTFDNLHKKFATVATEVGTGHEIWLTKGRLPDAIRASYALPGIFEPVKINGRWLFDGALVNPIPVTLCRALGADFVIAANLVSDTTFRGTTIQDPDSLEPILEKRFDPPETARTLGARILDGVGGNLRRVFGRRDDGAPGIAIAMMDAFNIAQGRISRSRLAGDPPDILINSRLGKIGLFDFHRADELIAAGREATRRLIPEIAADLSLAPAEPVLAAIGNPVEHAADASAPPLGGNKLACAGAGNAAAPE